MRQFSEQHIAALMVMALSIGSTVWAARRRPGSWQAHFERALALLILAGWVGEYAADAVLGLWTVRSGLPLQLTDAVSLTAILALLTKRPLLVELVYFWAFTATLQAVLTPDLAESFPSVFYFTYFIYHFGAIVGASYLVFGCRLYPRRGAAWRVYAVTLAFTAVSAAGDLITGADYMYLRGKPAHSSLLRLMGPWPLYIAETAALALAMLFALAALTRAVTERVDPTAMVLERTVRGNLDRVRSTRSRMR